jgi:hypothetical protein
MLLMDIKCMDIVDEETKMLTSGIKAFRTAAQTSR